MITAFAYRPQSPVRSRGACASLIGSVQPCQDVSLCVSSRVAVPSAVSVSTCQSITWIPPYTLSPREGSQETSPGCVKAAFYMWSVCPQFASMLAYTNSCLRQINNAGGRTVGCHCCCARTGRGHSAASAVRSKEAACGLPATSKSVHHQPPGFDAQPARPAFRCQHHLLQHCTTRSGSAGTMAHVAWSGTHVGARKCTGLLTKG